ncbi:aminotransferase class V-fold PLP-dependent enzyme, partial [Salmonella enterica]|uniref:aminotransferase class V-fold PLP-dependent enzyme n=1 Tax=Salmonella enterica TaxID=28901 RepID=UPI00398C5BA1
MRSFRWQASCRVGVGFVDAHLGHVLTWLGEYGIELRAAQRCAQPLVAELGVTRTLRDACAPYNT